MSGTFTRKWTDEQRRAVERAVLDESLKVPAVAKKAAAGELRLEMGGPKLEPFAMPIGTIRRTVDDERKRRRRLAVEAAAISDLDAYSREMIRQLLAETHAELVRMRSWLSSGGKRARRPAWEEIALAAKTVEAVARASAVVHKSEKPSGTVQTPEAKPSPGLVSTLAKRGPSRADAKTGTPEPGASLPTHVQQGGDGVQTGSAVPSYASRAAAG